MMTAEEMITEPKLVQSVQVTSCVEVTSLPADVIWRRVWSAVVSHLATAQESLLRMVLEKVGKGQANFDLIPELDHNHSYNEPTIFSFRFHISCESILIEIPNICPSLVFRAGPAPDLANTNQLAHMPRQLSCIHFPFTHKESTQNVLVINGGFGLWCLHQVQHTSTLVSAQLRHRNVKEGRKSER